MTSIVSGENPKEGLFFSTRWSLVLSRVQRPAATLRKDVERLRTRYGEILRVEVCGTLTDPAEVDEELRYLCQALTPG